MCSAPSSSKQGAAWIALAALVLLALNLRGPLTSPAPVIAVLRADLGLGPAAAGMLTTLPVLCFGLLTPLASLFIARSSVDTAVLATLAGVALGTVLRSCGGTVPLFAGTMVIGAALTIGNIVALMLIARDFPHRIRFVTGLYTACLNFGTMLTSGLTAPLAIVLGWRGAMASWTGLALLAIAACLAARRGAAQTVPVPSRAPATDRAGRRALVWLLSIAFAAHLCVYYSLTAWLPSLLADTAGMGLTAAGGAASVFQMLALLGSFGMPLLLGRLSGASLIALVGGAWIVTTLGLWVAPGAWLAWCVTGGIASGGGFTSIFMLAMAQSRDLDDNRRLSSAVQGIGYTLSAAGPMVIGAVHQAAANWNAPLLLLAGLSLPIIAAGAGVSHALARKPAR